MSHAFKLSKSNANPPVVLTDVLNAAQRLHGIAHRTPVLTSRTVNEQTGCQVYFKCENFQRTGSFKFRGAYNAIAQLSPDQKRKGVYTYSSGNHAQAIALAGKLLNVPTTIVMPKDAPAVKLAATRGYGADVVLYDRAEESREHLVHQLVEERGGTVIPPYNHPHVIAGQGTATKELIEEVGTLDFLLICCGGGGLLSGSAITARSLTPLCQVIGVEPAAGDDATRSFHTKVLQTVHNPDTIADGARTPSLGSITFPLVMKYVNDMVTVTDEMLLRSMFFLWERLKIVVEPTGALAAAALLNGQIQTHLNKIQARKVHPRIGVIISGGNVDLQHIPTLLTRQQGSSS
jgi:threo-3-hydroxy-L-aspartate ammonia-lyase